MSFPAIGAILLTLLDLLTWLIIGRCLLSFFRRSTGARSHGEPSTP